MLLQAAFLLGNVQWADTHEARLVLELLGYPKAQGPWHLVIVRLIPRPRVALPVWILQPTRRLLTCRVHTT